MPEPTPPRPRRPSDLAIASLVLGILSLVTCTPGPLFAIPAIICGYIARRRVLTQPARHSGRRMALAGLITGIIGFALWCGVGPFVFRASPSLSTPREMARRINCAHGLRSIGLVCMMYASDNDGAFPPDFRTLIEQKYCDAFRIYVCDSTNTKWATSLAEFVSGGQGDYAYFGAGLNQETVKNRARTILIADKTGNHRRYWNVVMVNDQAMQLIDPHNIGFEAAARQRGWIISGNR